MYLQVHGRRVLGPEHFIPGRFARDKLPIKASDRFTNRVALARRDVEINVRGRPDEWIAIELLRQWHALEHKRPDATGRQGLEARLHEGELLPSPAIGDERNRAPCIDDLWRSTRPDGWSASSPCENCKALTNGDFQRTLPVQRCRLGARAAERQLDRCYGRVSTPVQTRRLKTHPVRDPDVHSFNRRSRPATPFEFPFPLASLP
jgi:hypothetical protein